MYLKKNKIKRVYGKGERGSRSHKIPFLSGPCLEEQQQYSRSPCEWCLNVFVYTQRMSDCVPGARSRRNNCDLVTKFRRTSVEGVCDFVRVCSALIFVRQRKIATDCQCLFEMMCECVQERSSVCVRERGRGSEGSMGGGNWVSWPVRIGGGNVDKRT